MEKIIVEFINTWPTCDEHGMLVKKLGEKYSDKIEVKVYRAGKDFEYVKRYGIITKGTLIINQKKKFDKLNKAVIEKLIEDEIANI